MRRELLGVDRCFGAAVWACAVLLVVRKPLNDDQRTPVGLRSPGYAGRLQTRIVLCPVLIYGTVLARTYSIVRCLAGLCRANRNMAMVILYVSPSVRLSAA